MAGVKESLNSHAGDHGGMSCARNGELANAHPT